MATSESTSVMYIYIFISVSDATPYITSIVMPLGAFYSLGPVTKFNSRACTLISHAK